MIDHSIIKAQPVAIDLHVKDLDSVEWTRANRIPITHYWSGEPAPESRHADARILWSKSALHVRYVCHQAEPLVVSNEPQTKKKTVGLWDRDVCEIYITPDRAAVETYFEFEAAPTGEWLDVAIRWTPEKREADWEFNSHMTTAAKIEKDRITITMRIPWGNRIPEPKQGDRWRVNLFRCVGKDPNRGYLAWRPTRTPRPNFHVPGAFGWLEFE